MRAITIIPSLLLTATTLNGVIAADQQQASSSTTPGQRAAANVMMRASFAMEARPFLLVPQDPAAVPAVDDAPLIQIALLLDTSNSMDGLINQARSQVWAIVNSLGPATHHGRRPVLQVALYEYGKASIPAAEQHLRQVLPFTTDLDRVSEQLFALTTNGGEEYCGSVIRAASRGLSWSTRASDLKVMIIAGNEPFTQGMVDYRPAVIEAANSQGIVINTVFCGQRGEGLASGWQDGAQLSGGLFSAINQERAVVVIPAPQDDELARLGVEINHTYLAYGRVGKEGADRQVMQDANSSNLSSSNLASRACSKASQSYCNEHWDLVDAVERKAVTLAAMALADLPEGMRAMTAEQRVAYVAGKLAERRKIQERIQQLGQEREHFLAGKRAGDAPTLDDAIISSMRDQAKRRGFLFP